MVRLAQYSMSISLSLLLFACNKSSFDQSQATAAAPIPENEDVEVAEKVEEDLVSAKDASADETVEVLEKVFVKCAADLEASIYPIKALVYELAPETQLLPDFTTLTPLNTVCLQQLNISNRDFKDGFPGVNNLIEWFALDLRFRVEIPESNTYTFAINSDDGSKLYINNTLAIENDGTHGQRERTTTMVLEKGVYDFRVEYFQGPRFSIALELFWESSKIPKQYINKENILPNLDPNFAPVE